MNQSKRRHSLKQFTTIRKQQNQFGSPRLPSINQMKDSKKQHTKQLTMIVSKFTYNNQRQNMKYTQQLLRSAISVLKGFSITQNNFQNLFNDLHQVFIRFTMMINDPQIETILREYNIKLGYSYRKSIILLQKQLDNIMKDKTLKIQTLNQQLYKTKKQLQTKSLKYLQQKKYLQEQVQKYKKLADIQYMHSLQQKVQSLKNIINDQQLQYNQITKQNQQYLKDIQKKQDLIHDQIYQISKLNSDLYDSRKRVDSIQIYFNKIRDQFDGLLAKMLGVKQIIHKVQQQNQMLVTQRMKLINRSASAFQDLTPRPKYNQLLGISLRAHTNTTQDIFTNILKYTSLSNKQIIQKIVLLNNKNNKLQDAQAIRSKVVDDIISAKKQLDKVQHF